MTLNTAAERLAALAIWEHQRYDRTGVADIEMDARACEAASEVLAALSGEGAETVRDAVGRIRNQPILTQKYRELHGHFEVVGEPVPHKSGRLLCPVCFCTVYDGHNFCRWCGKRIRERSRGRYEKK